MAAWVVLSRRSKCLMALGRKGGNLDSSDICRKLRKPDEAFQAHTHPL